MAIPTFAPAKVPTLGTQTATSYRTLEAGFGDGYSQATIDGLNAIVASPSLVWQALSLADVASIKAQFDSFSGTTFSYQIPGDSAPKLWRCKKITVDDTQGVWIMLSASLEQAFDLS